MQERKLILTETALREYIRSSVADPKLGHVISIDTETTGLDHQKLELVGISVSVSPTSGAFIPVGFKNYPNAAADIPGGIVSVLAEEIFLLDALVLFYHAQFDRNVLEFHAGYIPAKWEDVLDLVHHEDPDRRPKDLKTIAKAEVGMDMAHIESLFTDEEIKLDILDMSTKDPAHCLVYATDDAIATRKIFFADKYQKLYDSKSIKFALEIDRDVIEVVRRANYYGGLELRKDYIEGQLISLRDTELFLEERIKRGIENGLEGENLTAWLANKDKFKISSPKQLGGILFDVLKFPSPGFTEGKNPQHKTDEGSLEGLAKEFPLIEAILLYRKVKKAQSTYFEKFKVLIDSNIKPRFNFNLFTVPTYRFAAPGGDPFRDGATGVNIQAVSNGLTQNLTGLDLSSVPLSAAYTGLPHIFKTAAGTPMCARDTCKGCSATCFPGKDPHRKTVKDVYVLPSVRQAFKAPDGYVLVSCDYERQELVVGANLSHDEPWLEALEQGEDLHLTSASDGFNIPLEDLKALPPKVLYEKRQAGKVSNFTVFYGGGPSTLDANTGMGIEEAKKFIKRFRKRHPQLVYWMEQLVLNARRCGYVTLAFGRRRWVRQFYESGNVDFADRSVVNTVVQGSSAEITRIAIARIKRLFEKHQIPREVASFVFQLHDEVSFIVRKDSLDTVLPVIIEGMKVNVSNWRVQLTVEAKIGEIWGQQKAR